MPINPMLRIKDVVDPDNAAVPISKLEDDPATALAPENAWTSRLPPYTATILRCAKSVGLIRRWNQKATSPKEFESVGTAFVIAPGLLMTNLHVLVEFGSPAAIINKLGAFVTFADDGEAASKGHLILEVIDTGRLWPELGPMEHDIAVLKFDTTGLADEVKPLGFALRKLESLKAPVATIGYPTNFDTKFAWQERQKKVFGQPPIAAIKRVSPDLAASIKDIKSGWVHSCSVLPGSSGSPLVDLETGHVLAVHYRGINESHADPRNTAIQAANLKALLESLILRGYPINIVPPAPLGVGQAGLAKHATTAAEPMVQALGFGVLKDSDDFRDLPYRATLAAPKAAYFEADRLPDRILNQEGHASCTAHALIHLLACLKDKNSKHVMLSSRMAYEMARLHDDFPGRNTEGSSLRGVIKGFFHNGLVPEPTRGRSEWDRPQWQLSLAASRKARSNALGAYYRLSPDIADYHSAIVEVGCVLVSARVHGGWMEPQNSKGRIVYNQTTTELGHAFVIVGYDETGFYVLNSAGPEWGQWNGNKGIAHWSYTDWADNLIDGWVLRPAVPAPSVFGKRVKSAQSSEGELPMPRRSEVLGHLLLAEQGELADYGRAASTLLNVRQTTRLFRKKAGEPTQKYQHLLLWAHGETTSEGDALRWIGATRNFFKSNTIYPVSLVTAPYHAIAFRDLFASAHGEASKQLNPTAPGFEELLSQNLSKLGPKLWASYRDEQSMAAQQKSQFNAALQLLVREAIKFDLKIHLVGHLGGCHLLSDLLGNTGDVENIPPIASLQTIASNLDWDEQKLFNRHLKNANKDFNHARHYQYCSAEPLEQNNSGKFDWLSLLELSIRSHRQPGGHSSPRHLMGRYENALIGKSIPEIQLNKLEDTVGHFDGCTTNVIWNHHLLEKTAQAILDRRPQFSSEHFSLPKGFPAL